MKQTPHTRRKRDQQIQLPLLNLRLKEGVSLLQSVLLPALVHLLNVRLKLLILQILIQLDQQRIQLDQMLILQILTLPPP